MSFDARAHVLHMAEVLELPLEKADLEVVIAHMQATANAAQLVMNFDLDLHIDAAPSYRLPGEVTP